MHVVSPCRHRERSWLGSRQSHLLFTSERGAEKGSSGRAAILSPPALPLAPRAPSSWSFWHWNARMPFASADTITQGMSNVDIGFHMATNVHLTPELESFARACVEGGLYNNVSEVVRSGLRLLKEQEDRRQAFDQMIARTLKEAEDEGTREMDDVMARVDTVIETAER